MADSDAMDGAFLVVAGKHAGALGAQHHASVERSSPPQLGFEAGGHVSWHDQSGRVLLGAWQRPPVGHHGAAWHVDDEQVVMTTGFVRWHGQPWLPEDQWARQLAGAIGRVPIRDIVERLRGVFAVVRASREGEVTVFADPLGYRCVYYGETDDVIAVSSKARLVAEMLESGNAPPPRDVLNTCWLAYSGHRIGTGTGFTGVHLLPPGGLAEIDGTGTFTVHRDGPWMPEETLLGHDRDDLIDLVRDEIADSLRASLDLPADRHVLRLTGGKDSRLLLAVAQWAGLAKDFHHETIGPPTLPDVQIASELAEICELRHEVRFIGLGSKQPYADRVDDFLATTAAMLNIWDLSAPNVPENEVAVVGLFGEALRSFHQGHVQITSRDDLVRHLDRQFGRLGLLQPDVAGRFRRLTIDEVLAGVPDPADPPATLHAFHVRNRVRLSRMGPQEELPNQRRIFPLYSVVALRVAFLLGHQARESELLHYEITRRCSDELARHRFDRGGWDPVHLDEQPPTRADPAPARRPTASAASTSGSLMQGLQRRGFDERKEFLRHVVDDDDNAAWEFIDRSATRGALDRFGDLSNGQRRELFGALTALLWCAGQS